RAGDSLGMAEPHPLRLPFHHHPFLPARDRLDYLYSILILVGIYIVLASSFNLIIGNAGLASIAHPIFFALGAYTAGLLALRFGVNPVLATLAGALVAAVFSLMMSLPSLRVSGDYLMITSIGFQLGLLQ